MTDFVCVAHYELVQTMYPPLPLTVIDGHMLCTQHVVEWHAYKHSAQSARSYNPSLLGFLEYLKTH